MQRFNSALALSLHGRALVPDGVFLPRPAGPDGRHGFLELPPPTEAEVEGLLARIVRRVTALLRRRGRLEADFAEEPDQLLLFAGRSPVARAPSVSEEKLPRLCARQAHPRRRAPADPLQWTAAGPVRRRGSGGLLGAAAGNGGRVPCARGSSCPPRLGCDARVRGVR